MERKRDPTSCRRRFRHHPSPHGGIAPGARVSAGYRKRLTAGPAVAPCPKPALAPSRNWRRVGSGPTIRFRRRVGWETFCSFDRREQKDGSGCYSVLEARKDRSIASIDFGALCPAPHHRRAAQPRRARIALGHAACGGLAARGGRADRARQALAFGRIAATRTASVGFVCLLVAREDARCSIIRLLQRRPS
jgi:hypothetical protein